MRDEIQIHNFMLIFQIHAYTGPLRVRMTGQIKISIPVLCKDRVGVYLSMKYRVGMERVLPQHSV